MSLRPSCSKLPAGAQAKIFLGSQVVMVASSSVLQVVGGGVVGRDVELDRGWGMASDNEHQDL